MKENVLSNIIDYVTENDVNMSLVDSIMEESYDSEYEFSTFNPSLLWDVLKIELNLDPISDHLLLNFKDAVESGNYMGASYMKKEILRHWDIHEDDFWRIGRDILTELKNGCLNSDLLSEEYTPRVGELLHYWTNKRFDELEFITSKLEVISDEMNHFQPKDELSLEILNSIDFGSSISHPLLTIEKVVTYFKFLSPRD